MHYPVPESYVGKVSQKFGVNPAAYAQFNLLGHNGVDYAVPVGTPVFSLDNGIAVEIGNDTGGYGLYVKVAHSWGESLYAHLSQQVVVRNQQVASGQQIGVSGNTGNSTGPHLHFGVRINPNLRDDGWNGHSDPQPFIDDISGRLYWIGPHLAGPSVGEMVSELGRWKPAVALYLDPSRGQVVNIKNATPGTKIVGRIYRPDSEVADRIRNDPYDAARWIDGIIRSHDAYGACDYWQVANEVCQVDWSEFQKLCTTMVEWQRLARGHYRCAIFGFSVGNPDMPASDRMAYWRQAIIALELAIVNGNVLLLHQYGARDLWGPDADWYINRWENQVYPRLGYLDKERSVAARKLVPTLKSVKVVTGEYGIDGLIYGERKGYKSYTTSEDYARQLISMSSYTARWPLIEGHCVYTCGHAGAEWADYDIWPDVAGILAGVGAAQASAGQPQPNVTDQLKLSAAQAQCISPNPAAALQKAIYADGFVPVGNEVYVTVSGVEYVCQKADHLDSGAARCYYVAVPYWEDVKKLVY